MFFVYKLLLRKDDERGNNAAHRLSTFVHTNVLLAIPCDRKKSLRQRNPLQPIAADGQQKNGLFSGFYAAKKQPTDGANSRTTRRLPEKSGMKSRITFVAVQP